MNTYSINNSNKKLNAFNAFRNKYGNDNFSSKKLAIEFANLKSAWWGSNLVFLGIEKTTICNGLVTAYNPIFNVFD